MNAKISKATKHGLKSSKKHKATRGGARNGAGRPAKEYSVKTVSFKMPEVLLDGIDEMGIFNKTAYISYLIAADLSTRAVKNKSKIQKIELELSPAYK